MSELIKALKTCREKDCENCKMGRTLLNIDCDKSLLDCAIVMLKEFENTEKQDIAEASETILHLKRSLKHRDEKITRLQNALKEYSSAAAEYGIDAQTMLSLAKSQISTVRDNCDLRHENEELKETIERLKDELEEAERAKEPENEAKAPCQSCGLVYEVSRSTYEIPKEVNCIIDNAYCPECGRRVKKEEKKSESRKIHILGIFGG